MIIPHYNSPEFLGRCLASIPARDDIQVIVTDDCSPCRREVEAVAAEYPGVEMIFAERNAGAGAARNAALPKARGRWLIFADADDFFLPGAWERFDGYASSDYDIVYFLSESADAVTLQPAGRSSTYNVLVKSCDNRSADSSDRLRLRHDVPWGKMIRRSLVEGGRVMFDTTRYCNDTMFSTKTGLLASKVHAEHSPVYCVTVSGDSLTRQRSPKNELVRYEVILRKNRLLEENGYGQWRLPVAAYFKSILLSGDRQAVREFRRIGRVYGVRYLPESWRWIKRRIDCIFTGKKTDLANA